MFKKWTAYFCIIPCRILRCQVSMVGTGRWPSPTPTSWETSVSMAAVPTSRRWRWWGQTWRWQTRSSVATLSCHCTVQAFWTWLSSRLWRKPRMEVGDISGGGRILYIILSSQGWKLFNLKVRTSKNNMCYRKQRYSKNNYSSTNVMLFFQSFLIKVTTVTWVHFFL